MAVPTTLSTQTYRISDIKDSRVDYMGLAQASCAVSAERAADLPQLSVELIDHPLSHWDEAKWDGVLRVCVARRGKPGAAVRCMKADN